MNVSITGNEELDKFLMSEEDEQDEIIAAWFVKQRNNSRLFKWNAQRLNWDDHKARLLHQRKFHRQYRMSPTAFDRLVEILYHDIAVDEKMSMISTPDSNSPIFPELVVAIGIRTLAGGSYHDITSYIGISDSSYYRCSATFCLAVVHSDAEELTIEFPRTVQDCERLAVQWQQRSLHNVVRGCVMALDGLLPEIGRPTLRESQNPDSYFSGHYRCYGLNCQGGVDAHLKFLFFAVAAPGKAGDSRAFFRTDLPRLIQSLPLGFYVIADNAYILSDRLLIPFKGQQRNDPVNSAYNFYLSQLRIQVERAFGLLTTKWRILRGGL